MAIWDIFVEMIDYFEDFSPLILLALPVIGAMVLRFVSMYRSMRLEGDAINAILFMPPGLIYFFAVFLQFFIPGVAFGMDYPLDVTMYLGDGSFGYATRLFREGLTASLALLAVCVLYTLLSRRTHKRAAGRSLPLALLMQNPLELVVGILVLLLSLLFMSGALSVTDKLLGWFFYLACVTLVQLALVGLALLWMLIFTNRRGEAPGKGANALERLRNKIRRRGIRSSLIWLMLVVFLSSMMLPALLMEYGREIKSLDDPFSKWGSETVSIRPDTLRMAAPAYSGDNSLLYAAKGELGIYIMVDREEAQALLQNPTARIWGRLSSLNGEGWNNMLRQDEGQRLPGTVESRYINANYDSESGVLWLLAGLMGVMLLVGFKFYLPAINPGLSRHVRPLFRLYPNLTEMMEEMGREEADPGKLYYQDDFHRITAGYVTVERFETIRLVPLRQVAAIHPDGETQFQIKLHSGAVQTLVLPGEEAKEALLRTLEDNWRIRPTPRPEYTAPPVQPVGYGAPPPAYPPPPPGYPAQQAQPGQAPAYPPPPPGYPPQQAPAGQPAAYPPPPPGYPRQPEAPAAPAPQNAPPNREGGGAPEDTPPSQL